MGIESREIERHGKTELLEKRKGFGIEVGAAVIEGYRHRSIRQILRVEPFYGLTERQHNTTRFPEQLQTSAKHICRNEV